MLQAAVRQKKRLFLYNTMQECKIRFTLLNAAFVLKTVLMKNST